MRVKKLINSCFNNLRQLFEKNITVIFIYIVHSICLIIQYRRIITKYNMIPIIL